MPNKEILWIEWEPTTAQPRPMLPDHERVFVKFRDGLESKIRTVGTLRWDHIPQNDDIVAYRGVEENLDP